MAVVGLMRYAARMSTCFKCGQPMDPASATYDANGELVCARCSTLEQIDAGDHRAAMSILGPAAGGALLGGVSICINPMLVCSVLAVLSCVGALVTLLRHPEYHARMGWRVPATWAFAIVGILLALVRPLLFALFLGL